MLEVRLSGPWAGGDDIVQVSEKLEGDCPEKGAPGEESHEDEIIGEIRSCELDNRANA